MQEEQEKEQNSLISNQIPKKPPIFKSALDVLKNEDAEIERTPSNINNNTISVSPPKKLTKVDNMEEIINKLQLELKTVNIF